MTWTPANNGDTPGSLMPGEFDLPQPITIDRKTNMTRDELIEMMEDGKIVGLTFRKADGSVRKMCARLGAKVNLKGGEKPYSDVEKNIVTVFDMNKAGYRSIRMESLITIRKNGKEVRVSA